MPELPDIAAYITRSNRASSASRCNECGGESVPAANGAAPARERRRTHVKQLRRIGKRIAIGVAAATSGWYCT
jgi:hypothetical protein